VEPLVRNPYLGNPDLFVDNPDFRDHIYLDADEFSRFLTTPWKEPFFETRYSDRLLRNRMMNELFHESVPVILHEDDLNAMYYSVENRSPFLDRGLFEFCNSIPTRHLINDGKAKAILREAVRGIAPDAIVDNPRKVGFNAPVLDYLDVNDPDVRSYLLDDSPIYGFVRKGRIEQLIEKRNLPNSESKFLFYFLNCKMFLEEFAG
jgi:asparagine synthase (glutamine-hydrolysing)